MIKKETLADLTLLFVAMAWGSNFVVIKDALDHVPPFTYLSVRFILAAVLTALIFWKKLKLITREDLIAGCIIGFFLFSSFATQTIGLIYTTPGSQALLQYICYTCSFYILLLSQKISRFLVYSSCFSCCYRACFIIYTGESCD